MIQKYILYVGTYSIRGSRGIYGCIFDPHIGVFEPLGWMEEEINPSFLALYRSKAVMYSVSEIDQYRGRNTGTVSAYRIDRRTGSLTKMNQVLSGGSAPCFLALDAKARFLAVANFAGGSIAIFAVLRDGSISDTIAVAQHVGAGSLCGRQDKPHPHCVAFDPTGEWIVVADLGLNQLLIYRFSSAEGKLTLAHKIEVHDAAGPRHLAFDRSGRHLFVVNEIDSTVMAFSFDGRTGFLTHLQTLSALPPDYFGPSDAAEIRLSLDGQFLYVSNRGADSLTCFRSQEEGWLTLTGHYPSCGANPLTFDFSPEGEFMIVANQASDQLIFFRHDPVTGSLRATGKSLSVPAPSSFVILPLGLNVCGGQSSDKFRP